MKKLNCRLIASDFDGTLADSENQVKPEVLNAINEYIKDGGIFAVCTGRILSAIIGRLRELKLKGLVVAGQGSVIADIQSGRIIKDTAFTKSQAVEICRGLESLNINVQAYGNYSFYSSMPAKDKYLKLYESIIGVEALHTDKKLSEFLEASNFRCSKFATLCAPSDREELYGKILKMFAGKYDVTCSANVLVEVSQYGETKGEALKFLAEYYGVPMDKTCAVGDNLNDLSMLEAAGYGIAVGNASDELKERVKLVTVTNDTGAVAKVIEKYGYIND